MHLIPTLDSVLTRTRTSLDSVLTRTSLDSVLTRTRTSLDSVLTRTRTSLDSVLTRTRTSLDSVLTRTRTSLDSVLTRTRTSLDSVLTRTLWTRLGLDKGGLDYSPIVFYWLLYFVIQHWIMVTVTALEGIQLQKVEHNFSSSSLYQIWYQIYMSIYSYQIWCFLS